MRLEILEYPDKRLRKVSESVTRFDADLSKLLDDMHETMLGAHGIGLAAPQVNRPLRVFIVDLSLQEDEAKVRHEFVNPKISEGTGKISFEEGCLSVPGVGESVNRKKRIRVDYQDRTGKAQVLYAEDLLAVAIQHEYDHLDGILFVDRLSAIKRALVKRKLERQVQL